MSSKRFRVGVVGAGNIASIAQLPTLTTREDVELRALVDLVEDPGPKVRRWGFQNFYRSVEEMVAAEELDAAFILTPRSEHAHQTRVALEAGLDVFSEKPLATSTADAQALADLAAQRDRILMVGLNRRFAPVYATAREAFAESGATFCVAQKNRHGSEYRATFENAIHMVDLMRWFCGGEPVEVTAHAAGDDVWEEDGVTAMVRFDNGNTGVLMAARNAGVWDERLDAYGAGVTAKVVAPDSVTIARAGGTTVREMTPEEFGWATATRSFGFAAAVHHFLDRVEDRQQPLTSGLEGAKTQALLDQILTAAGLPTQEQPGRVWTSHAKK